jgi:hypothetical protein
LLSAFLAKNFASLVSRQLISEFFEVVIVWVVHAFFCEQVSYL